MDFAIRNSPSPSCYQSVSSLVPLVNRRRQRNLQLKPQLSPHWRLRTVGGCQPQATTQHAKTCKTRRWPIGTAVVIVLVAKQQRVASGETTNLMKANTTRNLASVVMLVILTPFVALAMLVSIKTAGIRDNEVLLLLLTLSSAVLSGINGFGRRTAKSIPVTAPTTSAGNGPSRGRIPLSTHSLQ